MKHIAHDVHDYKMPKTNSVDNEIMKLVVDSYLHGAQTCELEDGTVLGVSIHQGDCDCVHLFIDDDHMVTIEVQNGCSRMSCVKTEDLEEHLEYIIPFAKSLGMAETVVKRSVMETVTV
ncbi:hypothetical protein [Lactococcus termiticola]|nr:hypothetical protein [Lactococcus termiticola]